MTIIYWKKGNHKNTTLRGQGLEFKNSAIVFAKVHIVMCFVQGRCESYFFSLLCYTLYNKLVWESSFSGGRKEKIMLVSPLTIQQHQPFKEFWSGHTPQG